MASPVDHGCWSPSGLVTLTTDFGLREPYVGIMKGVLHSGFPAVRCVDLTHDVPPQDVRTAAWYLAHAWRYFPAGTVHVAVVDPGVGTARAILVALAAGQAFLAPDNGLLGAVLGGAADGSEDSGDLGDSGEVGGVGVVEVRALDVERFALPERSRTFHGRDVFAPAAAALAAGCDPLAAGSPMRPVPAVPLPRPVRRSADEIELEVLLVDRFGNLITNLGREGPEGPEPGGGEFDLAQWELVLEGREPRACDAYGEARPGEVLTLVDSWGHLEIAVRDGDAARALDLGRGAVVTLRRRS